MPHDANYAIDLDAEQLHIFPHGKDGKSMRVTILRQYITLRHKTVPDCVVVFKRYLHQRRWYWGDSRRKGSVPPSHVRNELARMLRTNPEEARRIMSECVAQQYA